MDNFIKCPVSGFCTETSIGSHPMQGRNHINATLLVNICNYYAYDLKSGFLLSKLIQNSYSLYYKELGIFLYIELKSFL